MCNDKKIVSNYSPDIIIASHHYCDEIEKLYQSLLYRTVCSLVPTRQILLQCFILAADLVKKLGLQNRILMDRWLGLELHKVSHLG